MGTPPVITSQPQSITVPLSSKANFQVSASSGTTLSYQWLKDGTNISAANRNKYTISSVNTNDAGIYSVEVINAAGSVFSSPATLTIVFPPTITTQPQSQTVILGQPTVLSVVADGTVPLSFQWQFNGANLPGAINPTLTVANVQITNSYGSYLVVVSNVGGSTSSTSAVLTVLVPPSIINQPTSQTLPLKTGVSCTFVVSASGTSPFYYQWQFDGTNISGATNNSLTLNNLQQTNAGNYSVMVTNIAGSAVSTAATLTLVVPPLIITQPQSQTVIQGQNAFFSVVASGTSPLNYQWKFNNAVLAGATNSTLSLTNVQINSNNGSYRAVVSNGGGSATSVNALLTVITPIITLSTSAGSSWSGNGFNFQITATTGITYVILASTDLFNWMPTATNFSATGSDFFMDTSGTNYPARYYRAMMPKNGDN